MRSHVSRSRRRAAGQRGARPRQHAGAEPRARERHPPVVADRDPVAGEHLGEQRGRAGVAAQQHRDLRRLDALAHQLQHRGADQLGLGALAARLQQPHRAVGRAPHRARLEQRPLEVVQRRAGGRPRSTPSARAAARPRASGRSSSTVAARPANATRPGSYGSATQHVGAGVRDERLDRVALDRREVVEAVEEDGPPAPRAGRGAQRVERRPRVALAVGPAEPLEPPPVGGVERAELARRTPRGAAGAAVRRPRAQRRGEARRRDERALQLGEQRARRAGEARRRGRARERAQRRRRRSPRARPGRARRGPAAAARAPRGRRSRARAARTSAPRRRTRSPRRPARAGSARRRPPSARRAAGRADRRAQALEHGSRLGRVGRTGDQRQWHRTGKGRARVRTVDGMTGFACRRTDSRLERLALGRRSGLKLEPTAAVTRPRASSREDPDGPAVPARRRTPKPTSFSPARSPS